jgi:hypothetical protein
MATDTQAEKPGVFLRKASGVVRSWSPLDSWIYNVIAINIVGNLAMAYILSMYA